MNLETIATKFGELARGVVGPARPSRDDLAAELAKLEANPPAYVNLFNAAPEAAHAACPGCAEAAQEAGEKRVRYLTHSARVAALRGQMFRLSFGGPDELDDAGHALTTFRADLRRAVAEHERRRWGDRDEEADPMRPGKTVTTWTSPRLLAEISAELSRVGQAFTDSGLVSYFTTTEVRAAIEQARKRLAEIMARPVRERIGAEVAERAGVPRVDPFDARGSDGLVPDPRTPSVLAGTVRIKRR